MTLQQEIIRELGVVPTIDAKAEIRNSIEFLKAYLQKNPFLKTLVLGISGGQDSTLAGRLAQLTMEEMRSETNDPNYQFIAIRLPYGEQADEEDAKKSHRIYQTGHYITSEYQSSRRCASGSRRRSWLTCF